jgi:hypothetical protein
VRGTDQNRARKNGQRRTHEQPKPDRVVQAYDALFESFHHLFILLIVYWYLNRYGDIKRGKSEI